MEAPIKLPCATAFGVEAAQCVHLRRSAAPPPRDELRYRFGLLSSGTPSDFLRKEISANSTLGNA